MSESTQHEPSKKRRRWGCLRILLYCFAFCLIAPIIAFLIWTTWHGYRVNQMVSEIRAKGEPITLKELEKAFPLAEGHEDTTKIWQKGFEPFLAEDHKKFVDILPFVGEVKDEDLPQLGREWKEIATAESYLAVNKRAQVQFHEAARLGGYADFKPDFSKGVLNAYQAWQGIREAAKFLRLELEVHAHRGDSRKAAQTILALLKTSRAIENQPTLVSQLAVRACDGTAIKGLEKVLFRLDFTEHELLEFQAVLRSKKPIENFRTGIIGDRAIELALLSDSKLIDSRPTIAPLNSDRDHLLHYKTEYLKALAMGYPDCFEDTDRIEMEIRETDYESYIPLSRNYSSRLVYITGAVFTPIASRIIDIAAADLAIGIELFRRKHGRLPQSLDNLAPEYIKEIPKNPFTGEALTYRQTPDGFKIYGVNWRRIDHGGNFLKGPMGTWDFGVEFIVARKLEPIEKKPQESPFGPWLRERK